MNRYKFYYDKYGEFNCLYSNDYADRNYKNDDAIRKLQRIEVLRLHARTCPNKAEARPQYF